MQLWSTMYSRTLICFIITSLAKGSYVFRRVSLSVCVSVSNFTQKVSTNYDGSVRGGNINKWLNCGGDLGLLRWVKFFCVKNKWLTNVLYFTPYRLSPVYLNHKHTSEIPTRCHLLGIQTSSTLLLIKSSVSNATFSPMPYSSYRVLCFLYSSFIDILYKSLPLSTKVSIVILAIGVLFTNG